jgi:hypothetical protein
VLLGGGGLGSLGWRAKRRARLQRGDDGRLEPVDDDGSNNDDVRLDRAGRLPLPPPGEEATVPGSSGESSYSWNRVPPAPGDPPGSPDQYTRRRRPRSGEEAAVSPLLDTPTADMRPLSSGDEPSHNGPTAAALPRPPAPAALAALLAHDSV